MLSCAVFRPIADNMFSRWSCGLVMEGVSEGAISYSAVSMLQDLIIISQSARYLVGSMVVKDRSDEYSTLGLQNEDD